MKAVNDLDFLSLFWAEAKAIGQRVLTDLPKESVHYSKTLKQVNPQSTIKMFLVPYSQLGNSWSVQDILRKFGGNSKILEALADKINYMILQGRANDVKTMLEKICTGRIKGLSHPKNKRYANNPRITGEYLGRGHFKWNYQAYILSETDIKRVKEYFNLNNNYNEINKDSTTRIKRP